MTEHKAIIKAFDEQFVVKMCWLELFPRLYIVAMMIHANLDCCA